MHRRAARGERGAATVGRIDLHVRELDRQRPQMQKHVEPRDDALVLQRLRGLLHRPLARVRRAYEPDGHERHDARDAKITVKMRSKAPDARRSAALRQRRKARDEDGLTRHRGLGLSRESAR